MRKKGNQRTAFTAQNWRWYRHRHRHHHPMAKKLTSKSQKMNNPDKKSVEEFFCVASFCADECIPLLKSCITVVATDRDKITLYFDRIGFSHHLFSIRFFTLLFFLFCFRWLMFFIKLAWFYLWFRFSLCSSVYIIVSMCLAFVGVLYIRLNEHTATCI